MDNSTILYVYVTTNTYTVHVALTTAENHTLLPSPDASASGSGILSQEARVVNFRVKPYCLDNSHGVVRAYRALVAWSSASHSDSCGVSEGESSWYTRSW